MKKKPADIPLPTTTMYAKKASNFAKRRGHNILPQKVFGGHTFLSIFLFFVFRNVWGMEKRASREYLALGVLSPFMARHKSRIPLSPACPGQR